MSKELFKKPEIKRVVDQILDKGVSLSKVATPNISESKPIQITNSGSVFVEALLGELQKTEEELVKKIAEIKPTLISEIGEKAVSLIETLNFDPEDPESYNPVPYSALQDLVAEGTTKNHNTPVLADLVVSTSNLKIINHVIKTQWMGYGRKSNSSFEDITRHYLSTFQSYNFSLKDFLTLIIEKPSISLKSEVKSFIGALKEEALLNTTSSLEDQADTVYSLLNFWGKGVRGITDQYLAITVLPYYDMRNRMERSIGQSAYAIYLDKHLSQATEILDVLTRDTFVKTGLRAFAMQVESACLEVLKEVEDSMFEKYGEIQQLNEVRNFQLPMILNRNSSKTLIDELARYVQD